VRIAVWHNLPSGGGKRALYYHVRGLVQRGHEVHCWSLDNADHDYLPLSEFATERVVPLATHSSKRKLSDRWTFSFNEAVRRMQEFDDACRLCAREIDAGKFDLLFANSAYYFNVPYVLRHSRTKKVLYLQESCRYLYEARPVLPWVATAPDHLETQLIEPRRIMATYPNLQTLRIQAKQEWLNVQACDRLLVNSYFSRESAIRNYGVDPQVCYLGVDTSLFRDRSLKREQFVVGVGSFDPIKGVDLAIKSIALLDAPRPPLVWIANSVNEEYLKSMLELAVTLGVDLRLQSSVSDEHLVETLNRASVLVYTSRLEPFGFAPLEANACGLPVVGIAEGGIRETVEGGVNGFLVNPDPKSVAEAVGRLLSEPQLADRLRKQGMDHVQQHWNVEASVDRLEAHLHEVAGQ
jgi:glycosyltransferase involved in cell wall biosynthesis